MSQQVTPQLIKELRSRTGVGVTECKSALVEAGGDVEKAIEHLRKKGMASAGKKESRVAKEGTIVIGESPTHLALVEVNAETDFVVQNERFQTFAAQVAAQAAATKATSLEELMQSPSPSDPSISLEELRGIAIQALGENIQVRRLHLLEKPQGGSFSLYRHMGGQIACLICLSGSEGEENLAHEIAMHATAESPEWIRCEEVPDAVIEKEREIAMSQMAGKPPHILEKILDGKVQSYFDQVCLERQKFIKDSHLTIAQLIEQRGKEIGRPLQLTSYLRWQVGEEAT